MVHILWFPFFTQWYIFEIDPCWYMWTLSIHSNLEYSIMHINQLTYPWHSKMKNGSFPLFQNQKLGSTTILSHAAWRPCAHTPTRNTDKLLFPHVLTLDVTTLFFFFWCDVVSKYLILCLPNRQWGWPWRRESSKMTPNSRCSCPVWLSPEYGLDPVTNLPLMKRLQQK